MEPQTFTLTDEHLKLIRRMYVGWQDAETGAPEIDPKRPYGNSDVPGDVHEILTGEMVDNDEVVLSPEQRARYLALHRETETALQIVLQNLPEVAPGAYTAAPYGGEWSPA